MNSMTVLYLWCLLLLVGYVAQIGGLDLKTATICFKRDYRYKVERPYYSARTGQNLYCRDMVKVLSCWGRCDSSEVADWKMPYKISDHPVCTYASTRKRRVRLRHCHRDVPPRNRVHEVFDAEKCECRMCNTVETNCENLSE